MTRDKSIVSNTFHTVADINLNLRPYVEKVNELTAIQICYG